MHFSNYRLRDLVIDNNLKFGNGITKLLVPHHHIEFRIWVYGSTYYFVENNLYF